MFCAQCGKKVIGKSAKFCVNCGAALSGKGIRNNTKMSICRIHCVQVGEKWSVFGKDVSEFRALTAVKGKETIIAQSEQFIITGFDYQGPSQKNKKHKAAFDHLVMTLVSMGWEQKGKDGDLWYQIIFHKDVSSL